MSQRGKLRFGAAAGVGATGASFPKTSRSPAAHNR